MIDRYYVLKDPDAVLDYGFNWSDWLGDEGDVLTASSWTVDSGITVDSESNDTTTTTIWLSGGTVGERYSCVNSIETADGREDDRTIEVIVVQR